VTSDNSKEDIFEDSLDVGNIAMTVLDETIMSSSLGGDRYITPEYLAPLPQKDGMSDKSPLQMLAQTCSQIGADSGPKMIDKQKLSSDKSKNAPKSGSPTIVVSDAKPVPFKPYEITKEASVAKIESKRPSLNPSESSSKSIPMNSSSPGASRSPMSHHKSEIVTVSENGRSNISPKNSSSTSTSSSSETNPIMSSGMEILAGHPKDIPLGTYRPPLPGSIPGLDLNPAFRLPMAGLSGYPPVSSVAGSVCRDPYCKDPTCPTAVYNAYMARLSAARGLPPGYLELMEAQKMATMGLGGLPASVPTTLASSASLGPGGPYICNWMNGRDYCGKRYTSAEELLVHLKTHTNLSASDSALLNPSSAYAGLFAQSLMRQGGGQILPSAMSLQASRYSPYQRPGAPLPPSLSSLGGMPSPLAGLPPSLASLGYPASLYALYGARL